ncbi:PhoX family protein [Micromonospora phytophila]|uniref:alkaline phosphatase PhoX n=1 Tax=Micromonospora phytophila TaxID=709888 RepID=UPI002030A45C|nr:alkaline phosphatase PhoX [Micromonospora phytophila]MCM0673257.1 PhoX family protein [Micromonospora phytophila]
MDRRWLLRTGVVATGAVAFGGSLWRSAMAAPAMPGPSPYGPLRAADGNGLRLPEGFRSRIVARSGVKVPGTSYTWHYNPDGGATFATYTENGWIYVSNAEIEAPRGGASAIRFAGDGRILGAYSILTGTDRNCAGGPTVVGRRDTSARWLSGEEVSRGQIWECDPRGQRAAVARPAMGKFTHEAAAVDPVRQVVYLTEDRTDGCFYRFRPTTFPDLSTGVLEVLCSSSTTTGPVTWKRVPDPSASGTSTRYQVAGVQRFNGGEGCWYEDDVCYFTTKGDNRVWAYRAATSELGLLYDDDLTVSGTPLRGVDNITMSHSKDLYVAEDGDNMEICVITPAGVVATFLQLEGHAGSELTGVAFNPAGDRLYFSSQRGVNGAGGVTFEVYGPFRR